jgi:hypothetical protein
VSRLVPILLIAFLPVLWASADAGAQASKRIDASELANRSVERERQFLYRVMEELNRSQEYVQAAIRGLEKQIDAAGILEPEGREKDIGAFLAWYRSYAEWLGNTSADFEEDISAAYSDDEGGVVRAESCYAIVDGYVKLGSQLDERVARMDRLNNRTIQRIAELRTTLDYVLSAPFIEERSRDRKQRQEKKQDRPERDRRKEKDEMYERYKEITDAQIAAMQLELKTLDGLQKHFVVLMETGRMERAWISRKAFDYEALGQLARFVGRDAPDAIEEADNRMIRQYESDIAYFRNKVEDISRLRGRIAPSGSLGTLDRQDELTENYDQMKSRYERHIVWLSQQTGAYRADIIQIRKEK